MHLINSFSSLVAAMVILPLELTQSTVATTSFARDSVLFDRRAIKATLRPSVDLTIFSRESKRGRKLQPTENLCNDVINTVFAGDQASRAACVCTFTENVYTLTCDYSGLCDTFCTNNPQAGDYQCFDRVDTYTVMATPEFFINTNYRGCGTYKDEHQTEVCFTETRDMKGVVSGRCLEIGGQSCQCNQARCGAFNFQCTNSGPASPWEAFVFNECDDNAYANIAAGTVQSLLNSEIFDLSSCLDDWTVAPTTSSPTEAPSAKGVQTDVPTSLIDQKNTCQGFGCGTLTRAPSVPIVTAEPTIASSNSSAGIPSESPAMRPTKSPSDFPTVQSTLEPTLMPIASPSLNPTESPSYRPTRQPTHSPTVAPFEAPTSQPSAEPTVRPTLTPTVQLSLKPSSGPSVRPSVPLVVERSSTHAPTTTTIDRQLSPFLMWLQRDKHWEFSSLVSPVKGILVAGIQASYETELVDFRLECSSIDGEIIGRDNQTRVECDSLAKFIDKAPTVEALVQIQVQVFSDEQVLSNRLSDQVGQPVQVLEVIVEDSVVSRDTVGGDDTSHQETSSCSYLGLAFAGLAASVAVLLTGD